MGDPFESGSKTVVLDRAVEHQQCGFQAVVVLDEVGRGPFNQFEDLVATEQIVGAPIFLSGAARGVTAGEGGL